MDLSQLYNNPDYSDLTIILSDSREIKVHKNILCTANEWFKKACGVDSRFAEASQKVLELKHDDPDALEHVLQHIYSIPPPSSRQDVKAWRHWLDVHLTADKYLEFNLSAIARNEFTRVANSQRDSNEIFDILEAINDEMKHDEGFVQLAHSLREFNIEALLQNERVCKKVDEDKEWRWEIIDSLIAHRNHSGERSIFLCEHHIEQVFEPGRKWQSLPCSKCRKNEPRPVVNTRIVYSE